MRVRDIRYFENKIIPEMNKPTEKRYLSFSSLPKNIFEEQNYKIALYFVEQFKNKQKLVA